MQGPLDLNTLFMVYRYRDEYPMTIVAPSQSSSTKIAEEIYKIMEEKKYHISLFLYDTKILEKQNNQNNRFFQYYSTEIGLRNVTTEYTLKIRNDEIYTDLEPFVTAIEENPSKITTSDIFFRNSKTFSFHPSDHLVGGKTAILLDGFSLARKISEDITLTKLYPVFEFAKIDREYTPEQQLCLSFLAFLTTKYSLNDHVELMKSTFLIVRSKELGSFHIKQNHKKEHYTDESFFDENTDINDITKYI